MDGTTSAKKFGRDITNSGSVQPRKTPTKANVCGEQIAEVSGECEDNFRELLRIFVRREWNGNINPATRTDSWKLKCKTLQSMVGKYKLPYAPSTEKRKKLRGSERREAKKKVVMEHEEGIKLILSAEKEREATLMRGTQIFWKKDKHGDFVYYDETTKRRIDASEYYRRYLRHLKTMGSCTGPMQTIAVGVSEDIASDNLDSRSNDSNVDIQVANAVTVDYERSIQEAEIECWRAIQQALNIYDKRCRHLKKHLQSEMSKLDLSDDQKVHFKNRQESILKSYALKTTALSSKIHKTPKEASSIIASPSCKNTECINDDVKRSERRKSMVQLSDRFKQSERRKSLVTHSPTIAFAGSDIHDDEVIVSKQVDQGKESQKSKRKRSSKSRRRSLVTNFQFQDYGDQIDEDDEDD